MKYYTNSEKETEEIVKKRFKNLKGGEVILLEGDLGSGKTFTSKVIASLLGVKDIVNSPTFVFMKVYKARKGRIKTFVHVDAYRAVGEDSFANIGLEDYIQKNDCVVVIEWPGKIKKLLPQKAEKIKYKILDEKKRELNFF